MTDHTTDRPIEARGPRTYHDTRRRADAYTERTGNQAFIYCGPDGIDWIAAAEYYHYRPDIRPNDIIYSTWEGEYTAPAFP